MCMQELWHFVMVQLMSRVLVAPVSCPIIFFLICHRVWYINILSLILILPLLNQICTIVVMLQVYQADWCSGNTALVHISDHLSAILSF